MSAQALLNTIKGTDPTPDTVEQERNKHRIVLVRRTPAERDLWWFNKIKQGAVTVEQYQISMEADRTDAIATATKQAVASELGSLLRYEAKHLPQSELAVEVKRRMHPS